GYLSLPCFNDLHHVRPGRRGHLLIAVTGLDLVVEVSLEGEVTRRWSVLEDEEPFQRFDESVDYRRVATTKPHRSHPNFLVEHQGEVWVSRFEQRDAISLSDPRRRIAIGQERPHDGLNRSRRAYFSTVDGHLVLADLETAAVERVVDLNAIDGRGLALGWCRGVRPLTDDLVLVGFSRLRPSRFRENLRWVKHRLGQRATAGDLPTRIVLYDLAAERQCWQFNLEDHGLNALFSIHLQDHDDIPEGSRGPHGI
ncbi:MAG: hypothetical protein SX243_25950, partial [Acidobacteriota bacterium]|nr:hypothetical protein [Acidobacteriota bacterium]